MWGLRDCQTTIGTVLNSVGIDSVPDHYVHSTVFCITGIENVPDQYVHSTLLHIMGIENVLDHKVCHTIQCRGCEYIRQPYVLYIVELKNVLEH